MNENKLLKPVKIAVSGAHSTGKTTFLKQLSDKLVMLGWHPIIVTDLAVRCPLPILRNHTPESALWIVTTQIAEEIAVAHHSSIVLVDRPVVDAWVYLMAVFNRTADSKANPAFHTLESTIKNWLPTYDIILTTRIEQSIPIENSKGRDLDPNYRLAIGEQMELAYKYFEVESRILLSSNAESELETIIEFISKKYECA
ncbi:MAG: AAA family ATPase [Nostoc sp.]